MNHKSDAATNECRYALEQLAQTAVDLTPELRAKALDHFKRSMEQHGCPPEAAEPYYDLVKRRIAEIAGGATVPH